MGIPKFFRFISERWPMISQLIDGSQIPEFDTLYLDMNSILHTCTRPKDEDSIKKLTEEEVFTSIFAYIDHLFDTIKPQKVFYMAIDGVAPRAKMNQQRARRFRTAVDAEKRLKKAIENGEELPEEEPWDSNSITPGTEFMHKLTRYLKYFVHKKVSTDSKWQNCEIILSGHEVPGEGEHKIMEFIRNKKAHPDYDPNTRHCVYGLDADLIMLGLVSHDPHFALLREEVTFGRRSTQAKSVEEQKFYLLHISLVREYLELEFEDLKEQMTFEYNFERVLDDFILILYVIGNDFLPNLPDLHLNKGAFPLLLETFKEALRGVDGYINEFGTINLKRLGFWLDILSKFELENFEQGEIDLEWFNKQLENISLSGEKKRERIGKLALLKKQRKLVGAIKPWLIKVYSKRIPADIDVDHIPKLDLPTDSVEDNLDFLKQFAHDADLVITHSKSTGEYSVRIDIDGIDLNEDEEDWGDRVSSIRRIIKRYEAAVILDAEGEGAVEEKKQIYNEKFETWKDNYYKDKLGFSIHDEKEMKDLTQNYIEGLQWVLYYYYKGCQSWPWYYRYHYAPRISDIKKGLDIVINLQMGKPFKPFEQLMAVLPARSDKLVPAPYRQLMTSEHSPIRDFYPDDVETDLNGKTADWEAVVKLSFVDPTRLQEALAPLDDQLSAEEKFRNSFGRDILFTFNPQISEIYKSPLPGVFSDLEGNHCYETTYILELVDDSKLIQGLVPGVKLAAEACAGFPTLKSISFTHELKAAGLLIFNFPSKSTSIVLSPKDSYEGMEVEQFAKRFVNKVVWTRYPYLRETKVVKVTDGQTEYFPVKQDRGHKVGSRSVGPEDLKSYKQAVGSIQRNYSTRRGIELKNTRALVTVKAVTGIKRTPNGAYVKEFSTEEELFPLQLVVDDVKNKDQRFSERPPLPINEEFPVDSKVIFLGDYAYGGQAAINGYATTSRLNLSVTKMSSKSEPQFGSICAQKEYRENKYFPSFEVARNLRIHPLFLSKITSSFMVENGKNQRVNVGLDLKFDSKREKVVGFTRKTDRTWEFSNLAISLLQDYKRKFPHIFSVLSNKNAGPGEMLGMRDLFPGVDPKQADSQLQEVISWLKEIKTHLARVSLESDHLSKKSMKEIEDQIEVFSAQPDKQDVKKLVGVPRDAVLDPSVSFNKLKAQSFKLGDRVVYVHDSGKVPLFSKGTVAGYHSVGGHVTLQIIFDKTLMGGNKLDGRLRTNRGLDVDSSLVLNVSNKQFIFHSKASSQKKPSKAATARIPHQAPKAETVSAAAPKTNTASTANGNASRTPVAPKTNGTPQKPVQKKKKDNQKNQKELLSLLKREKTDTERKDIDEKKEVSAEDDTTHDPARAHMAKSLLQASIMQNMNPVPPQQIMFAPPPMGMYPPQAFPGGFAPQGFPPQGFPMIPIPYPQQVGPVPTSQPQPQAQAPQNQNDEGKHVNGNKRPVSNERGRGGQRGGRGGQRGKPRGKPTDKSGAQSGEKSAEK